MQALREGIAPVRDRLLAMGFLAALVHALVILGLSFNVAQGKGDSAPGLEVLLVSDELPEADRNETAAYLAQRTQQGAGNTTQPVAPRNSETRMPLPGQSGVADGAALVSKDGSNGSAGEQVLTTSGWSARVTYLAANSGQAGESEQKALQVDELQTDRPGPEDETGPAQLRGPVRGELWITPDTRAARLAPYLDAWRRKVERIGTLNYPAVARQAAGQARPVLEVAIAADGKLAKAVVRRSSGTAALDQAALDILKLASPFDPFPPELSREYRLLRFAYEWQFVAGHVGNGAVTGLP